MINLLKNTEIFFLTKYNYLLIINILNNNYSN